MLRKMLSDEFSDSSVEIEQAKPPNERKKRKNASSKERSLQRKLSAEAHGIRASDSGTLPPRFPTILPFPGAVDNAWSAEGEDQPEHGVDNQGEESFTAPANIAAEAHMNSTVADTGGCSDADEFRQYDPPHGYAFPFQFSGQHHPSEHPYPGSTNPSSSSSQRNVDQRFLASAAQSDTIDPTSHPRVNSTERNSLGLLPPKLPAAPKPPRRPASTEPPDNRREQQAVHEHGNISRPERQTSPKETGSRESVRNSETSDGSRRRSSQSRSIGKSRGASGISSKRGNLSPINSASGETDDSFDETLNGRYKSGRRSRQEPRKSSPVDKIKEKYSFSQRESGGSSKERSLSSRRSRSSSKGKMRSAGRQNDARVDEAAQKNCEPTSTPLMSPNRTLREIRQAEKKTQSTSEQSRLSQSMTDMMLKSDSKSTSDSDYPGLFLVGEQRHKEKKKDQSKRKKPLRSKNPESSKGPTLVKPTEPQSRQSRRDSSKNSTIRSKEQGADESELRKAKCDNRSNRAKSWRATRQGPNEIYVDLMMAENECSDLMDNQEGDTNPRPRASSARDVEAVQTTVKDAEIIPQNNRSSSHPNGEDSCLPKPHLSVTTEFGESSDGFGSSGGAEPDSSYEVSGEVDDIAQDLRSPQEDKMVDTAGGWPIEEHHSPEDLSACESEKEKGQTLSGQVLRPILEFDPHKNAKHPSSQNQDQQSCASAFAVDKFGLNEKGRRTSENVEATGESLLDHSIVEASFVLDSLEAPAAVSETVYARERSTSQEKVDNVAHVEPRGASLSTTGSAAQRLLRGEADYSEENRDCTTGAATLAPEKCSAPSVPPGAPITAQEVDSSGLPSPSKISLLPIAGEVIGSTSNMTHLTRCKSPSPAQMHSSLNVVAPAPPPPRAKTRPAAPPLPPPRTNASTSHPKKSYKTNVAPAGSSDECETESQRSKIADVKDTASSPLPFRDKPIEKHAVLPNKTTVAERWRAKIAAAEATPTEAADSAPPTSEPNRERVSQSKRIVPVAGGEIVATLSKSKQMSEQTQQNQSRPLAKAESGVRVPHRKDAISSGSESDSSSGSSSSSSTSSSSSSSSGSSSSSPTSPSASSSSSTSSSSSSSARKN